MAQVSIYQTGTRTSHTDTGSVGQEITLNKAVIVTGLIIPNVFAGNSQVYPYIYRKSDGVRIGSGPVKQQTAMNANEIYPLSSPVRLEANTSYILAFAKNDTNAFYYSLNNVLNDSVTEPTTGIVLTYKGGGLTGAQSSMPTNTSNLPNQDFCFGIVADLPANGKIKDQAPGTLINFAGSLWTILEPSTGYIFKNESIGDKSFDTGGSNGFNPSDFRNVGYYLNTTYFNTLPNADKAAILSKTWVLDIFGNAYYDTVNAKICLLTSNEWNKYSKKYAPTLGFLSNPPTWMYTRTRLGNGLIVIDTSGENRNIESGLPSYGIYPTLYINPETNLVNGAATYNAVPTINLNTENNQTLYENDVINISGEAYDANKDQSVTVFYQINSEQRKVLAINASLTQITLSKQLTFKSGKIYDGEVALTGTLAEGVPHTLKVWAVDSENGQSATIERTFYVVPNRAPLLSVDAVVPSGVVDADKFKVTGNASDQDANSSLKVTRKINSTNPVEIYSGPGGAWEFDVSLAQLVVGDNTIIVEVIDNYGAKTSKTIKLKKNEVKTPILHAVGRYKIKPPAGSAKGVLLFIERDADTDLKVELSMTLAGEQEQYETLSADNTAPMPNTNGSIVEDTYYYEATEPKDNIILKLSTTRPDTTVNHKIHLISGAVE